MKQSEKYACNKIVKDSLEIFMRDGYITDLFELREYIKLCLKQDNENMVEYTLKMILQSEKYKEINQHLVKKCKVCEKVMPISDFSKYRKDGEHRRTTCRSCCQIKNKQYKNNNKDKVKEINKKYCTNLKNDKERYEKFLKQRVKYLNANKEKVSKKNKKYCLKRFLENKLERELTKEEINIAFQYKNDNDIKENIKVFEKFYPRGGNYNA